MPRIIMAVAAIVTATAAFQATAAQAQTVTPTSQTASSYFSGFGSNFAIDASANGATTDWASNSQGSGSFINLDLGSLYNLTSARVVDRVTSGGSNGAWVGGTYDFTTGFSLSYYADATFTNPFASFSFTKNTPINPSTPADFAYAASLISSPATQFVRYTVLEANGQNPGLSNISFQGSAAALATAALPEPATWAMMLLGFGAIGGALRRRQTPAARIRFV